MKCLLPVVFLCLVCLTQGRDFEDARVIVAQSTKTAIIMTTSTTTAFYTCASAAKAATCQRRRYRRLSVIDDDKMAAPEPVVDGSLLDQEDVDTSRVERDANDSSATDEGSRDPRIAFTLWTTTSSTFTVTSTSINSSTTFSLSYFCTISGLDLPPACG